MPRKFFVAFALTCLSFGRQPVFFDASPAEPIFIANPIANDSATSSEPVSDIPINRETKAVLDELAGIVARVEQRLRGGSVFLARIVLFVVPGPTFGQKHAVDVLAFEADHANSSSVAIGVGFTDRDFFSEILSP